MTWNSSDNPPTDAENSAQRDAVAAAAQALIESGVLGPDDGDRLFLIHSSGHANAGHEFVHGQSPNFINLSIRVESAAAAVASAVAADAREQAERAGEASEEGIRPPAASEAAGEAPSASDDATEEEGE